MRQRAAVPGARRGAAAVRLPAVGRGARRRADDGVGRGVRPAAVYLRGGRVYRAGARFCGQRLHRGLCRRQLEHAAAGVVPGGRHWGGARGLAAAVGAAVERLDPAVAVFSRPVPADIVARVLAVMGMVCAGFLLFILFTSSPFVRTLPAFPVEGRDLNPLLQDPGLIFHPPLLYMGYVGFSVAFAFAIAALLSGRLDSAFARFARPWTLAAWVFLTLGIVLGSAWAYYELGWGGWWFWDPVENASFMPWLAGTALLHSLAVTEQRAGFKAWTLLLSICAFSLCLLGTFRCAPGCWCRCTPSPPTRRAGCLSSPLWCWSPAARCCCSPCAGTGCVRG
ncbi:hypothetical protein EL003_00115 [Salmonella enterica subsp. salamae serovar 42:r:-]|nr:hypothetical protein EL003_00115 [Salmonella enterica subsp. salamae serovar 42:r:-]